MLVVGKTGSGKSSMLRKVLDREIARGAGALLLDPHGDLAFEVAANVPRRRWNDTILFDPRDEKVRGLNPFARLAPADRPLAVSNLLAAFKKLFGPGWGPRTEHLLRNAFLALCEVRGATLLDASRMLFDEHHRAWILKQVKDEAVKTFWFEEFSAYGKNLAGEAIAAPLNKLGAVLGNPRIREVVTKSRPRLDIPRLMSRGGVLVASMPKGILGEDSVLVLGAMILGAVQAAAMRRADITPVLRRPFTVVVDELGSYAPEPLLELLAEGRKYKVSLVLACQSLAALEKNVRSALLANAGCLVAFNVSGEDAELLNPEFAEEYGPKALTSLQIGEAILRRGHLPPEIVQFPFTPP